MMRARRTFLLIWLLAAVTEVASADAQPTAQPQPSVAAAPSQQAMQAVALVQSNDPFQQELGFLRLEALREPATVGLIQPYVNHHDPDLRAYAVRALAAIQGAAAVPLLLNTLKADRSARVRGAAILGMEPYQSSSPMMLPALLKALRDRSPEVRITAIDVVSRIHDPRAREAILTRNKRERHQDVRRALGLAVPRVLESHASSSPQ